MAILVFLMHDFTVKWNDGKSGGGGSRRPIPLGYAIIVHAICLLWTRLQRHHPITSTYIYHILPATTDSRQPSKLKLLRKEMSSQVNIMSKFRSRLYILFNFYGSY